MKEQPSAQHEEAESENTYQGLASCPRTSVLTLDVPGSKWKIDLNVLDNK